MDNCVVGVAVLIEKFPLRSVSVLAAVLSSIVMEAFSSGCLLVISTTFPLIVVCECVIVIERKKICINKISRLELMRIGFFFIIHIINAFMINKLF